MVLTLVTHMSGRYLFAYYARHAPCGLLFIFSLLLNGCASLPETAPPSNLIDYALSLQGAPYEYGKASPEEGFDCSGFVQHVYATQGVRLPRTVNDMFANLPAVSKSDLQAGDLVFFNIVRNKASHVGLYVQADQFIHAPSSNTGQVQISSLNNPYWRSRFTGVRRPKRPNQ
jgi:cell wall-associated NlpC family hydrolase